MQSISFDTFKNSVSLRPASKTNTEHKKITSSVDNSSIKPLENDKFELSKSLDKKSDIKKSFLISVGTGLTALAAIYAVLAVKNHKSKKLITQIYDKTFDYMAEELKKIGVVFVKPKLKFDKLKNANAAYMFSEGEVIVNKKMLNKRNFLVAKGDKAMIDTLGDGKNIYGYYFNNGSKIKKIPEGYRRVTEQEYLLNLATTMRHELTHARQDQLLLNSKNGLEKLLSEFKKAGKIKEEATMQDFLTVFPFYKNYKPSKEIDGCFALDLPFPKEVCNKRLKYSADDIVKHVVNYNSDDPTAYYNNLLEVEARIGEYSAAAYLKQLFPGVEFPPELIKRHTLIKKLNIDSLLNLGIYSPKAN